MKKLGAGAPPGYAPQATPQGALQCPLVSLSAPILSPSVFRSAAVLQRRCWEQPGNLQEVLLHETAVSWIRRREALNRMTKPWEETPEQFAARMKSVAQEINDTLNVEGLCRAFKQRVQKLVDRGGDRISH